MKLFDTDKVAQQWATDENIKRIKTGAVSAVRKFPRAASQYALDKVPIVRWLPCYDPHWLLSDFIAGLTVGVMMVPQALAYAKIANIDGQYGLYSAWLPAAVYVFMGTSKDLSTGPTSILGLLTAEVVSDLSAEGFPAHAIASAIALMVGIYSLALGLLRLGFVLDYISIPVLSGFLSAAAITIALGQVGSLVGLSDVPSGTAGIIHSVLSRIGEFKGLTCAVGFSGIAVLYVLEVIGRKWGHVHPAIKFLSSSRAVIVLFLFTTLSYLLNRNRGKNLLWDISKVATNGLISPTAPSADLLSRVAGRSIAPLVAATIEHLAIGRAFGRRNGYELDTSQELVYLGLTNAANSLFGAMAVGGAMSRTAVNSECGVKSPLSGAVTAGLILLTLYKLDGALYWIPKATLSAIIIMAVIHIIGPVSLFYRFWRASLADFTAAMLCFWITLFVSTETGIEIAVLFSVAYTMVRSAFAKAEVSSALSIDRERLCGKKANIELGVEEQGFNIEPLEQRPHADRQNRSSQGSVASDKVPPGTLLVAFSDAVFFPNARRIKATVLEAVQTRYDPISKPDVGQAARSWSVAAQRRIQTLRGRTGVGVSAVPLGCMVWDFGRVPFVDYTGVTALRELKEEVTAYIGQVFELRAVGLADGVRNRFIRAGWVLREDGDVRLGSSQGDADVVVYRSVGEALWDREVWEDGAGEGKKW